MERKFYNNVFTMKADEDKVFATLEGNITRNEIRVDNVKVGGKDRKVARASISVQNKVEAKMDYALGKYDKSKSYSEKEYITIVAWDSMADVLVKRVEKAREMNAEDETRRVRLAVAGTMKKVSYQGKNGEVQYLELTIPNEDGIRFVFPNAKGGSQSQTSQGTQGTSDNGLESSVQENIDDEIPF